ncbi:MAG: YfhO family protein, partial [Phycisphaerae bacterium]|nr:YfhO family protein [Phycisphaerae bacterium]
TGPRWTPVAFDRPSAGLIRANVKCQSRSLLILNETYDPGWQATMSGQPTKIVRVNAVVQGVVLPAGGQYQVEWRFLPPGLWAGAALSLVALLILAFVGFATIITCPKMRIGPYK